MNRSQLLITLALTWLVCVPTAYYFYGPSQALVAFAVPPVLATWWWLMGAYSGSPRDRRPDSE